MSEAEPTREEVTDDETVLGPRSTLNELFGQLNIDDGGVKVIPITVQEKPHDTRLMVVIRGEHKLASIIMSELVGCISDMSAQSQQPPPEEKRIVSVNP